MRVFICGIDGYLGWTLAHCLSFHGHVVGGIDSGVRRDRVADVGGQSILPLKTWKERADHYDLERRKISTLQYGYFFRELELFKPDAVVHLGEQPSAPWSHRNEHTSRITQHDNVIGSLNLLWSMRLLCPDAHLVKLGTMGEYGTPGATIPEAAPSSFPRKPGSFYHASKVHDSVNCELASKIWGLRVTDVMQGIVYGSRITADADTFDDTRFDADQYFGTAINRFVCQAIIGHPLTVYGTGGQTRTFLPLRDSMKALALILNNPPKEGEYRVVNQFSEVASILEVAEVVRTAGIMAGHTMPPLEHVDNPRAELEDHQYVVKQYWLPRHGYHSTISMVDQVRDMFEHLQPWRIRIDEMADAILPTTTWR